MKAAEIFNRILNSTGFKIVFFGLCLVVLFVKSDRTFGWTDSNERHSYPVLSDGTGYYAYLPQWFTYRTDKFQFADTISGTYPGNRFVEFAGTPASPGPHYNKYYPGSAVCMTPFYLAAKLHAGISGHPSDGYSWPFLLWCNLAVICFTVLGAFGLFCLLRLYNIGAPTAYLTVITALFATNLCYYTTVEIPFSHGFCFAVNTWILVHVKRWANENRAKHFYRICLLTGLALIIRPTNIFILAFIPFMFPTFKAFFEKVKTLVLLRKKDFALGMILALVPIFFFYWNIYTQTGSFSFNAYPNETFSNWKSPYVWEVLFSYKKGLFVYAPVFFLLVPALIYCFVKQRRVFWGVLIVFFLVTYFTSSWWIWWFGGGLGARNFIDFMGVFSLAIALFYQASGKWIKTGLTLAIGVGIWMYQVYDYQMRYSILHYSEITKEGFWTVFMKTDLRFKWYMVMPFDKKPSAARFVGTAFHLTDQYNKAIHDTPVELKTEVFQDDPKFGIRTQRVSSADKKIGVDFKTDIRIYEGDANPLFYLFAYKNDSLIEQKSIQFGGRIASANEFAPSQLYLNLESKWNEADSVVVWLNQSNWNAAVKNTRVQFYAY